MLATLLATTALGLIAPAPAAAFRSGGDLPELPDGARIMWAEAEVALEVAGESPPGLSAADVLSAVEDASRAWNVVDCAAVRLVSGGLSSSAAGADDGRNTVYWVRSGWQARGFSPDAAATTDVRYREVDGRWQIAEADIYLNAEGFRFSVQGGTPGDRDLRAVLTHELGHMLGLLHPCEVGALGGGPECVPADREASLYPVYLGVSQRAMGDDDVAGLCWLYPADSAPPADPPPTLDACADGSCPPPNPEAGDPCLEARECATGVCAPAGYCTTSCVTSCPQGFACATGPGAPGVCTSGAAVYGEPCVAGAECVSHVCLRGALAPAEEGGERGGMCTRGCDPSLCPGVDECREVQGRRVCAPPLNAGGCAVTQGRKTSGGSAATIAISLLALLGRRRRRRR